MIQLSHHKRVALKMRGLEGDATCAGPAEPAGAPTAVRLGAAEVQRPVAPHPWWHGNCPEECHRDTWDIAPGLQDSGGAPHD